MRGEKLGPAEHYLTVGRFFCHNLNSEMLPTSKNCTTGFEKDMSQSMPAREETDREYQDGYNRVMWFAQRARRQGWHLSDRQLVHEIYQRERAARIREQRDRKSTRLNS